MGISVYAKNSSYDFCMGYGGFSRLRRKIAHALNEKFGEHYETLFRCRSLESFSEHDRVTDALVEELSLDEDIVDFLYLPDCNGSVSYRTCRKLYDLLKDRDISDVGFQYESCRGDDWNDFKKFLLECYQKHRRMRWD